MSMLSLCVYHDLYACNTQNNPLAPLMVELLAPKTVRLV